MAIDSKLLEILACPLCRTRVVPIREGSGLKCPQCGRVYAVLDSIPNMLVDQATIEPA